MRQILRAILLGVVLTGLAGSAIAREGPRGDAVSSGAPPVVWGRPLAGGTIRVLAIAPQFTLRDADELAARLDVAIDAVPLADARHLGSGAVPFGGAYAAGTGEQTTGLLYQQLDKRHDLILIGNVHLDILPEDVLSVLQKRVKDGAGLVLVRYGTKIPESFQAFLNGLSEVEDAAGITQGIAEEMTPEWSLGLEFVHAYPCEKGRVVTLDYPGPPPDTHFLLPPLSKPSLARTDFKETYFSLVAKAARWAAGREPSVRISGIDYAGPAEPDAREVPPDLPPEFVRALRDSLVRQPFRAYRLRLAAPAPKDLRVTSQVRESERSLRLISQEEVLPKGESGHPLQLLIGPGSYVLDVWVRDGDKTVDWYSEAITVDAWPAPENAILSKSALLPNDSLEVSFSLRALFHQPRPCLALARAADALGRVVAERYETVSPEGGTTKLVLEFADLISDWVRIDLYVADRVKPPLSYFDLQYAAHYSAYLPVRRIAAPGVFRFVAQAGETPEYNARASLAAMGLLGIDMVQTPATLAWRQALGELALFPLPQLTPSPDETTRLQEAAALFYAGGSGLYSLGTGASIDERDPAALRGFQESLQQRYVSLDALNDAWATPFARWEDVEPASNEEASVSGHYASVLEFQRYLGEAFAANSVKARNIVRGVDRSGRAGLHLTGKAVHEAAAFDKLAQGLDFLAVDADSLAIERLRSYRAPDAAAAVCVPSGWNADRTEEARWLPWDVLFHQGAQLWWPGALDGSESAPAHPALAPDGLPTPAFAAAAESVAAIRSRGLDTLLLAAERTHPVIAIYDSVSSALVNAAEPSFGVGKLQPELAFARLLEQTGHAYDLITPEKVLQGRLDAYKLLLLPAVRTLSDAEATAIRRFHATGGNLIAGLAPGQFDERGVPRDKPPLDDLFGIRHETQPKAGEPCGVQPSDAFAALGDFPLVTPDVSVRATDGVPGGVAGGTPVWLRATGKGGAVFLMNHVPAFPAEEDALSGSLFFPPQPGETSARALMALVLDDMGIAPSWPAAAERDVPPDIACYSFRYGKALLWAFLRGPEAGHKKEEISLRFDEGLHVYEAISGTYFRNPRKPHLSLLAGEAKVLCALPYAVTSLQAITPKSVVAGGRLPIQLVLKSPNALLGDHPVRIDLLSPDERTLSHYTQRVTCRAGQGEAFIPLGLNEAPGRYTICAMDLLTGIDAQTSVTIMARPQ